MAERGGEDRVAERGGEDRVAERGGEDRVAVRGEDRVAERGGRTYLASELGRLNQHLILLITTDKQLSCMQVRSV